MSKVSLPIFSPKPYLRPPPSDWTSALSFQAVLRPKPPSYVEFPFLSCLVPHPAANQSTFRICSGSGHPLPSLPRPPGPNPSRSHCSAAPSPASVLAHSPSPTVSTAARRIPVKPWARTSLAPPCLPRPTPLALPPVTLSLTYWTHACLQGIPRLGTSFLCGTCLADFLLALLTLPFGGDPP